MNFSSQGLLGIQAASAAASSSSSTSPTIASTNGTAMANPISAITGAVNTIFGTIGDAIKGKTKKDLMRQQGNQQLVQQATDMHSRRLAYAQPKAKKKEYTTVILLGIVAVFVFTILVLTLKKS